MRLRLVVIVMMCGLTSLCLIVTAHAANFNSRAGLFLNPDSGDEVSYANDSVFGIWINKEGNDVYGTYDPTDENMDATWTEANVWGSAGPGESVRGSLAAGLSVLVFNASDSVAVILFEPTLVYSLIANPGNGGASAEAYATFWYKCSADDEKHDADTTEVTFDSNGAGGTVALEPFVVVVEAGETFEFAGIGVTVAGDAWEPIPEPSTLLTLGSGLMALAGFAIRRRR